jgi:SAP domain
LTSTLTAADIDQLDAMSATQLKALCKEQGLKVAGKKDELSERLRQHFLSGGTSHAAKEAEGGGK